MPGTLVACEISFITLCHNVCDLSLSLYLGHCRCRIYRCKCTGRNLTFCQFNGCPTCHHRERSSFLGCQSPKASAGTYSRLHVSLEVGPDQFLDKSPNLTCISFGTFTESGIHSKMKMDISNVVVIDVISCIDTLVIM